MGMPSSSLEDIYILAVKTRIWRLGTWVRLYVKNVELKWMRQQRMVYVKIVRKKKKMIIKGMAFTAAIGAGIAGIVYVKKNPEMIDDLKETFNKVPSLFKRESLPIVETAPEKTDLPEDVRVINYLTDIDQKKIDMAYKKGIFDKWMIKRQKGLWESEHSTVDELLRIWGATDIIDSFPKWKDKVGDITKEQFEDIVMRAAENVSDVKDVKVFGDQIQLTVKSKSGKSAWNVF